MLVFDCCKTNFILEFNNCVVYLIKIKTNIHIKKEAKQCLHKTIKFGTLEANQLYIFVKDWRNALKLQKIFKQFKFERDWVCLVIKSSIKYLKQNREIQ